jgi:hypothetical protein
VTYATANGFDPSLANYAYVFLALLIATSTQLTYSLAICNGCSILGRIFPLIAAQKVGPINTLILFSFTSAIMLFVWTQATDIPGILTYDAFYGISSGNLNSSFVEETPDGIGAYAASLNPGAASFAPDANQSG